MEAKLEENRVEETNDPNSSSSSSSSPIQSRKWTQNYSLKNLILEELKLQRGIILPLIVLYITWFARITITTAFLGRLGELSLAGGTLAVTIANVTGFSVLNGLSAAMEPICGQAFGAKNIKLLHKTLVMAIILLLISALPIAFLWLNVDKILIQLGQEQDISMVAKKYLLYLLPDLLIYAFLCPLKAYLSSQSITVPIMLTSGIGLVLHVPFNFLLSRAKGLEGVAMAVWMSDLVIVILLALYVSIAEFRNKGNWKEGGWWEQSLPDWVKLLKLSGPCCLTTCLEWWCYEILFLLAGHLQNAKQSLGVLAIVINFDYLLYSVMISLSTCASVRISNELGANQAGRAFKSAYISLGTGIISGFIGASIMVSARGIWGHLFSHNRGLITNVKKMLLIMAIVEVFNFPLSVCGGIVRGTARPQLGMYANLTGFYLLALPVGVILAFKLHLGLAGMLIGFVVGSMSCLILLLVFIMRIDWDEEASKARIRTSMPEEVDHNDYKDEKNSVVPNDIKTSSL
ncbi:hypothetical protein M9H77_32801 [Catharanthus roseus]|uniref:Uncharacterized protein n=1 Tax=Catharanthus roseus TaxID=4058 RepID=A0ACC0A488_CATRO|nr:hypothetical protein M9H77_32801 [Catharanthus roseus]